MCFDLLSIRCKTFLTLTSSVTLANDEVERDNTRAFVPYAPLYPTFQERLDQFRRGKHSELLLRGVDKVVHNLGIYDTRRSSEDRSTDVTCAPKELVTSGFSETDFEEEEQALQPNGDTDDKLSSLSADEQMSYQALTKKTSRCQIQMHPSSALRKKRRCCTDKHKHRDYKSTNSLRSFRLAHSLPVNSDSIVSFFVI